MWVIPETSEFYHFVRGTEDSKLDWPEHWIQHLMSCLWRSSAMLKLSSVKMRLKKNKWLQRLCGLTLKPSQQKSFEDALISYFRDTPASHLAVPENDKEPKTPDTFGRILNESCRQLDLFGASSRTSPGTLALDSQKFTEAYEIWVTKLRQDCLQRQRSAHRTREKDCLSWQSPRANDAEKRGNIANDIRNGLPGQVNWPTPDTCPDCPNSNSNKKNVPKNFQEAVNWGTPMWPTVTLQDAENNAGPSQHDRHTMPLNVAAGLPDQDGHSTNGKNRELWMTPEARNQQGYQVANGKKYPRLGKQAKGKLNPDWVEQLMGLTVGWTDLNYSETELCRNVQKKHS